MRGERVRECLARIISGIEPYDAYGRGRADGNDVRTINVNVTVRVGKRCNDRRGLFQRGFGTDAGRRDEMGGRSRFDVGKGSCGNSQLRLAVLIAKRDD